MNNESGVYQLQVWQFSCNGSLIMYVHTIVYYLHNIFVQEQLQKFASQKKDMNVNVISKNEKYLKTNFWDFEDGWFNP